MGERGQVKSPRCRAAGAVALLAAIATLPACDQKNAYVPPPPPKVVVALPVQRPITRYLEETGNAAAVNTVDLVARVPGFLEKVNYVDGASVARGAVLFVIEQEPNRLKLEQAQAAVAGAQATLAQAEAEYQRQAALGTKQFAAKSTVEQALAAQETARASLQQAQVNEKTAAVDFGYTQVTAPFDGVVSARQVSVGELVGASAPTVLATIVQLDPIYVNFTVNEQDVERIRAEMARRGKSAPDLKKVPVEVGLQTEAGYPHTGHFDYAAPSVNASTGTLAVRAVLPNGDHALLPGSFVRVRVPFQQEAEALLVPDAALGVDQAGRYLLVVSAANEVEQRHVAIGPLVDGLRVIERGLDPADKVVVGGIQRAVPGQKVAPQMAEAAPALRSDAHQ